MPKKLIPADEKVPLMLTAVQRKLVLEDVLGLDQDLKRPFGQRLLASQ